MRLRKTPQRTQCPVAPPRWLASNRYHVRRSVSSIQFSIRTCGRSVTMPVADVVHFAQTRGEDLVVLAQFREHVERIVAGPPDRSAQG